MKGSHHALAGAAIGGSIAYIGNYETITSTAILVGVSIFASLAPDLDTNGKLSRRMTISYTLIRQLVLLLGFCIAAYMTFWKGYDYWIGSSVIIASIVLTRRFITPKAMNIFTSIVFIGIGGYFSLWWLIGLGIFFGVAAWSPHRGITHTVFGLLTFSGIAFLLQAEYYYDGLLLAAFLGYSSHLLLDMKCIPLNKRGVKLFYPFLSKEW